MSTPNPEYPHRVGVCDLSWAQYVNDWTYVTGCKVSSCRFTITTDVGRASEIEANVAMSKHVEAKHSNPETTTDEPVITARIRSLVERLTEQTGIAFTFGYVGNCGTDRRGRFDDRMWYVFAPHPGRVGTNQDNLGGYRTENLDQFIPLLHGALELTKVLAVAR